MRYLISGRARFIQPADAQSLAHNRCAFATQFRPSQGKADTGSERKKHQMFYLATEIQWAADNEKNWLTENQMKPKLYYERVCECVRRKKEEIILFLMACKPNWSTNL